MLNRVRHIGSLLLAGCCLCLPAWLWNFPAPSASTRRGYDAILVCGGGLSSTGLPPWVDLRVKLAAQLYHAQDGVKPYVIMMGRGTTHRPPPRDAAGFTVTEAQMGAKAAWLVHGVAPEQLLEESVSLDTIGNAHFTRLLHTETLGLKRLAVITSHFHMPRVRAVFSHVFSIPSERDGRSPGYALEFVATDDEMPADVLAARNAKEALVLPRFAEGSAWRRMTPSMRELHVWMFSAHRAYSAKPRLNQTERQTLAPLNSTLSKSYRA
jgi:uncharacterized SAM-binding protein YcdF (DUF218 family)